MLNIPKFDVMTLDTVDSTNSYLKRLSPKKNTLVVANEQTNGRGRQGKSFFSPKDTGIYMSVFLDIPPYPLLTPDIAVSVCDALDKISPERAKIKWVNDIFLNGKKVAGILTERHENGVIIGIGINISTANFPDDIKNIAGSLNVNADKSAIIADIVNGLMSNKNRLDCYKKRLFFLGKEITFIKDGISYTGTALDINEDGNLIVRTENETMTLISGEISLGSGRFV
ncbi:MAG: biotin--[acetyl-CoA-carboxylase] ligase [Clostridia bacterium]|nr:biotin--[acetyl-CoA-carboxylase] ligase [Clostridia bacterium]